jgi:hypothetical protein
LKIKDGFLLRQVAGSWIVIPFGANVVAFNAVISLNDTGALIWENIASGKNKKDIVDLLVSQYETAREIVASDYDELIEQMRAANLLEE